MSLFFMKKMIDESNKAINPNAPKRRSLLSFLFIPNLTPGISPIRETVGAFVNLLAMLFVMNGLFPKNHPGLNPRSNVRLGFWEVMRTAKNNLVFTKEKLPQTLFFFAVVGCIGIVVLTAAIAFFSLFIGHAHAQTSSACSSTSSSTLTSMFAPCGGSSDIASMFIQYLFNGTAVSALDPSTGASPINDTNATVIQCGLYVALGYYSDALLIIAALILFYHLAWMTVETAHHGNVMGQRGNQIWAPIRLVFAIGLLVPVGNTATTSCTGSTTGMNSGQLLVIQIATWGSGLASNVWAQFLNAVAANTTYKVVPPSPNSVRKIVHDSIMMYACQWAVDWYVDGRGDGNGNGNTNVDNPANANANSYLAGWGTSIVDLLDVVEPNADGWQASSQSKSSGPDGWSTKASGYMVGMDPYNFDQYAIADDSTVTASSSFPTEHFIFSNAANAGIPICGSYTIQGAPIYYDASLPLVGGSSSSDTSTMQGITNSIYKDQAVAYSDMMFGNYGSGPNAYTAAVKGIQYFIPEDPAYVTTPPPATGSSNSAYDILTPLVTAYQTELMQKIVNDSALDDTADANTYQTVLEKEGWLAAGAWFNFVSRMQTDLTVAATDGMPKTQGPNIDLAIHGSYDDAEGSQLVNTNKSDGDSLTNAEVTEDVYGKVRAELQNMDHWLNSMNYNTVGALTDTTGLTPRQVASTLAAINMGTASNSACISGSAPFIHSMDCLALVVDLVGNSFNIWRSAPTCTASSSPQCSSASPENLLGIQFTGANPLAEIADYGNELLATAYTILDYGVLGSLLEGGVSGALGAFNISYTPTFGAALTAVGGTLFTLGFLMAYFVPLIPFIQFFFGVIAWIVAMLEAVIMVPLIALAHLNPEGDGLPGEMARSGYFLIFQVFLRPVLMIFGLICGFLIFYLAVTFLNALFAVAVAGTGGLSHGHFTIARVIYTAIYVMLVVVAANHSFELVSRLPNMSMQWLGAGGAQGLDIESVAGLESRTALVSGYVSQQAAPQISNAAAGAGRIGGTAVGMAVKPMMPEKPTSIGDSKGGSSKPAGN